MSCSSLSDPSMCQDKCANPHKHQQRLLTCMPVVDACMAANQAHAHSHAMQPASTTSSGDNPPCNTLFVGNLCETVNEAELQSIFGGHAVGGWGLWATVCHALVGRLACLFSLRRSSEVDGFRWGCAMRDCVLCSLVQCCPRLLDVQGFRQLKIVRGRNTTAFVEYDNIENAMKVGQGLFFLRYARCICLARHVLGDMARMPAARVCSGDIPSIHPIEVHECPLALTALYACKQPQVHGAHQGAVLASNAERGGIRIQYSRNPFGKKRDVTGVLIDTPVKDPTIITAAGPMPAMPVPGGEGGLREHGVLIGKGLATKGGSHVHALGLACTRKQAWTPCSTPWFGWT